MADDGLNEAWEKAAKDITKGKNEGALQTLRAIDPQARNPMTARLVGEATWNIAKANDSKSDYRKAAMFLREASKANPKDKKTSSLYNKLLNEMQDKRISETVIPRMFNNGGPTPAGIIAIFGGFLLILGLITIANTESTTTDYVDLNISWTENGATKTGTVSLELHANDAPAHAENFKQLVLQGKYDGTKFHRVIDDFMIQGGDFTNGDGTGGHAAKWYGICDGDVMNQSDCPSQVYYNVPDEANNGLEHTSCTISMAKTSMPNTGGSQFFLMPDDITQHTWLDGVHTVFGTITSGCEHVTTLSEVAVDGSDRPILPVVIHTATASD
ncbi:MAG: peptidylprolyl isomerase [Candidatus Poseidoniaceae archaeon]